MHRFVSILQRNHTGDMYDREEGLREIPLKCRRIYVLKKLIKKIPVGAE
jgi:hypothetical protein